MCLQLFFAIILCVASTSLRLRIQQEELNVEYIFGLTAYTMLIHSRSSMTSDEFQIYIRITPERESYIHRKQYLQGNKFNVNLSIYATITTQIKETQN
jgi:hypothetical protein